MCCSSLYFYWHTEISDRDSFRIKWLRLGGKNPDREIPTSYYLKKKENNYGPNKELRGTPLYMDKNVDLCPSAFTAYVLFERKFKKHLHAFLSNPVIWKHCKSKSWFTESEALVKSMNKARHTFPLSSAVRMSFKTLVVAVTVYDLFWSLIDMT